MKDESWVDCIENNSAKKVSPDLERADSLIETSKERLSVLGDINEKNCNFVFEDYYTSLLEILQAMTIKKGYKVLNHICIGFYLRDVMKKDELYELFNDLRYKRNSLTYYGNRMDFETAKHAIERCNKLINEIMSFVNG